MSNSVLRFNLSGKTAFFKSNEVNEGDINFTYGHIHKPALLGILGAIIGLGGHNQAYYSEGMKYIHPEFYEKLRDIKVAIIPRTKYGAFRRKIFDMVNTCGYSLNTTTRHGQNMMYREQWLISPSWDIYILLDSIKDAIIKDEIVDFIINGKAVYMPYLGKTNHMASVCNGKILEYSDEDESVEYIDSFYICNGNIQLITGGYSEGSRPCVLSELYEYRELLPIRYSESNCFYESELFILTNKKLSVKDKSNIFSVEGLNLFFF